MKKLIISVVFSISYLSCLAQEGFKFEINIAPNTTYTTQMVTETNGIVEVVAEEELLKQMKAGGFESPMEIKQEMSMIMISTTEDKSETGAIPARMRYEKISSQSEINGQVIEQPNPIEGMQILGYYNDENVFEIDSIIGTDITEQLRTTIAKTMENIQKQIDFPKTEIHVGDTFNNEIPMSIPMQGMNPMEIVINTTYRLKEISKNIAYFDLKQSITLNSEQEQMKMSANGAGDGTCAYSIKDNYLIEYSSELPMNLSMDVSAMMRMKMKMDTKTTMSIRIE